MDQNEKPTITSSFNIGLFLFSALVSGIQYVMTSEEAKSAHPVGLVISIIMDACFVLVLMLIVAAMFKAFWDRLIT